VESGGKGVEIRVNGGGSVVAPTMAPSYRHRGAEASKVLAFEGPTPVSSPSGSGCS
jgi:hypothetical protein